MGMEGINWGEVNSQCRVITADFYNFYEEYIKATQQLFDELSYIWASGNAVKSCDTYIRHTKENASWILSCEREIVQLLNDASWTYANTFNTKSELYLQTAESSVLAEPHSDIDNPFKERVNGITGMNKKKVEELTTKYVEDTTAMAETFSADVCAIEVSILDNQNAQKEAFSAKVGKMCKKLTYDIDQLSRQIHFDGLEEIDRMDMVKGQTVNTFNA